MSGTGTQQRRQTVRRERDQTTRSGRRRAQRRASLLDLVLQAVLVDRAAPKGRRAAGAPPPAQRVPAQRQPQSWSRGETPSHR